MNTFDISEKIHPAYENTGRYPNPAMLFAPIDEQEQMPAHKPCTCNACVQRRDIEAPEANLYTGEPQNTAPKPPIQPKDQLKEKPLPLWLPILVGAIFFIALVLLIVLFFKSPEAKPLPIDKNTAYSFLRLHQISLA